MDNPRFRIRELLFVLIGCALGCTIFRAWRAARMHSMPTEAELQARSEALGIQLDGGNHWPAGTTDSEALTVCALVVFITLGPTLAITIWMRGSPRPDPRTWWQWPVPFLFLLGFVVDALRIMPSPNDTPNALHVLLGAISVLLLVVVAVSVIFCLYACWKQMAYPIRDRSWFEVMSPYCGLASWLILLHFSICTSPSVRHF